MPIIDFLSLFKRDIPTKLPDKTIRYPKNQKPVCNSDAQKIFHDWLNDTREWAKPNNEDPNHVDCGGGMDGGCDGGGGCNGGEEGSGTMGAVLREKTNINSLDFLSKKKVAIKNRKIVRNPVERDLIFGDDSGGGGGSGDGSGTMCDNPDHCNKDSAKKFTEKYTKSLVRNTWEEAGMPEEELFGKADEMQFENYHKLSIADKHAVHIITKYCGPEIAGKTLLRQEKTSSDGITPVRARAGGAGTVEGENGCSAGGMDGGCDGGGGCGGGGDVDPDSGEIVGVSLKNWNARIERKTDVVFGCGMDGEGGGEGGCGGEGGEGGMGETEKYLAPGEFDFDVKAFFGDKQNNSVIIIDPIAFEILDNVPTGHQKTYTPDHVAGNTKLYISNRGSNAVDVMDQETNEIISTIPFKHFPRSGETWNTWDELNEISGMDKPMATIIDTKLDKVVFTVGDPTPVSAIENPNFGGGHACGHPLWLDEKHFVLLDRYKRLTHTYYIERVKGKWGWKLIGTAETHSSIHQITPRRRSYLGASDLYYGTAEGAKDTYPELIEFRLGIKGLQVNKVLKLVNAEKDPNTMWLHHSDFHPESTLLYVPSGDGTVFVVDYTRMQVVKTFKAGKGAGHTFFIPQRNYAFVINHKDYFITVADMKTNEKIKDIPVSGLTHLRGKKTLQAHPGYYVSKDWKYFYMFLTEEGAFIRVDLDTLSLAGKIDVGGKPAQGSFVEIEKEGGSHSSGM